MMIYNELGLIICPRISWTTVVCSGGYLSVMKLSLEFTVEKMMCVYCEYKKDQVCIGVCAELFVFKILEGSMTALVNPRMGLMP